MTKSQESHLDKEITKNGLKPIYLSGKQNLYGESSTSLYMYIPLSQTNQKLKIFLVIADMGRKFNYKKKILSFKFL